MAFVVTMWLVTLVALFVQGIHIIRTGQTAWFFAKSFLAKPPSHPPLASFSRLSYALIHILPSIAMMLILFGKLKQRGLGALEAWLDKNSGMLFWTLLLGLGGTLWLLNPAGMLRWSIRTHPELADNRDFVIMARVIGLLILGMALFILAKL